MAPSHSQAFWTWFRDFLRGELAPYPGRCAIAARMVVAVTSFAVVCMTFRIPYAYQGAVYALIVSHETLENNWQAAFRIAFWTILTTLYVLVTATLFAGDPPVHFLWNVASFFLAFFCVSAMREYAAAVPVAVVIGTAAVAWDQPLSAGAKVAGTLWLCLSCLVAVFLTAAVSALFAAFEHRDNLLQPLLERLLLVEEVLKSCASGIPVSKDIEGRLDGAILGGNSAWRLSLRRSGSSRPDRDRLGATGALITRLVDIAGNLQSSPAAASDRADAARLARVVAGIRAALHGEGEPNHTTFDEFEDGSLPVREIAHTLELMSDAWARPVNNNAQGMDSAPADPPILVPDAFTNHEHLKFALRGCFAATICYVFYNAVAWQGLNSAIASCMFTALSSVGASTQKLAIRLAGAILGGVILGMGTQIVVFPRIDSIFAFTLVFAAVSTVAAWFMTCSPRLSYLGLQIGLAFYLVHLQSFKFETSVTAARDRIAGVLLGLAAMWLVFDHLWSSTAGVLMKRSLVRSFRLLAQLAQQPISEDWEQAMRQTVALRETTSATLDQTQSLSDAVLFEFGRKRAAALKFRSEVRGLQPLLRSLFVMRVSALEYRLRLPGFEVAAGALGAQRVRDERSANLLEELADQIDTGVVPRHPYLPESIEVEQIDPSHFALLQRIDRLIGSLAKRVECGVVQQAARVK